MVIKTALQAFFVIFMKMIPNVLPRLPDEVWDPLFQAMNYLTDGVHFLGYLLGDGTLKALATMFSIIFDIEIFLRVWDLGWWLIKKIPFFNITE